MSARQFTGFMAPVFAVALTAAACGGGSKEEAPAPASSAPAEAAVDPATAANISGTIKLEGTAPAREAIKMNADPVCMKEGKGGMTEAFVASAAGDLANVFVYVKGAGVDGKSFPVPAAPVTLDQQGCRYHPHVMGIQVGQGLDILNSDPTLHNIHALPKSNQEFNTGQPIKGMKTQQTFSAEEVMVPFKCDVHGWMNAYAGVLPHPFFAVSGEDGKFEIKGLPPGTYTVIAWHEKLGPMEQSITVGNSETKEASFTFKMPS